MGNSFRVKQVCPPAKGEHIKTFVMYYPDVKAQCEHEIPEITVRGSTASYSDFVSRKRPFVITLSPVMYSMTFCSIPEALLTLAVCGVSVDFVEMFHTESWKEKITSFIDLHKSCPEKAEAAVNFPRYYVVATKHSLPYAVVDRFEQPVGVDFMAGKFDRKAVKCRFADRQDAAEWCAERIGRAEN